MTDQQQQPGPDQNDPTGRARPGSPSYKPATMPANNFTVKDDVREEAATDEDAEEEAKRSNDPVSSSNAGGGLP